MWTLLPLLGLMAVFFLWGFFAARSRGRSGFMWGLACSLTAFIGIAILYSLGDRRPTASGEVRNAELGNVALASPSNAASAERGSNLKNAPAAQITGREAEDDRRWRYLCEYHPQVRKAVAELTPLGPDALLELKTVHLAMNDASVLPDIVDRISAHFEPVVPARRNGGANGYSRADAPLAAAQSTISAPRYNGSAQNRAAENDRDRAAHDAADPDGEDSELHDNDEPLMLEAPVATKESARASAPANGATTAGFEAKRPLQRTMDRDAQRDLEAGRPVPQPDEPADDIEGGMADDDLIQSGPMPAAEVEAAANGYRQPAAAAVQSAGKPEQRMSFNSKVLDRVAERTPERVPDKPAERTVVTPADLQGARFLETYAGVHLFGLADGRVFIDRHEARGSLDLARSFVDQVTSRRVNG